MLKLGTLYILRAHIPVWTYEKEMFWNAVACWIPIDSVINILELKESSYIVHTHLGVFIASEGWLNDSNVEEVA